MKTVVSMLIAIAMLLAAASAQAETTLYVGDTKEYAIAFKAEEAQFYIVELAAKTQCFFTEPREDLGPGGFSAFATPTLMRSGSAGLTAAIPDSIGGVRAEQAGDEIAGDFYYHEIVDEGFHCDAGPDKTFRAAPYLPFGSGGAPASGERPVYYGNDESTETFLRLIGGEVGGIRGTFVPQCPIGRGKRIPASHALFDGPSDFTKLDAGGSFEEVVFKDGRIYRKTRYRERISFTGSVAEDAVTGTYLRVRTVKPRRKAKRRCVTGPIPFRAVRYLPAAP
ncbi:MAG TPA: hypothetical protein VD761_06925 [Solirubrobacterales bacterium]|nr:hypothetical protein [Solirubrobacterales bacterium]